MADVYNRPLAAFFMADPPSEEPDTRIPDFRRPQIAAEVEPRGLQKAVLRAGRQQDALREIAAELAANESTLQLPLVLPRSGSIEKAGGATRQMLRLDGLSLSILARPETMLRELISRTEALNVTVIQVQNVDVQVMRGFSLGSGYCPIIALNGADWPRGKVFTILHELAHVAMRSSGLCDLEETDASLERRCNRIAAAALMPKKMFRSVVADPNGVITAPYLSAIGSRFGVSGEAALLRMIDLDMSTWEDYHRLKPDFTASYRDYKRNEKENSDPDSPLFYQLKARDLGRSFVRKVLHAYAEDIISSRDLTTLLEVKYDQVSKLASRVGEVVR